MKKTLFLAIAMLVSGTAVAATDHYLLRDGNHVQHLKITKAGNDTTATVDVDFEANPGETGHACSAEVTGDTKSLAENELVLKKHIEGEARNCSIKIHLTPNGAKLEQSEECGYFAAGICRFSTDGKELIKIK
jgi:hypothetical protein